MLGSLTNVLSTKLGRVVGSVVNNDSVNASTILLDDDGDDGDIYANAGLGFVKLGANATLELDLTTTTSIFAITKDRRDLSVSVDFCYKKPQAGAVLGLEIGTGLSNEHWKSLVTWKAGANLAITSRVQCVQENVAIHIPELTTGLKLRLVSRDPHSATNGSELLVDGITTNLCLGK